MHESGSGPERFRWSTLFIRLVVVIMVLGVAAGGLWLVVTIARPSSGPTTSTIPAQDVEPADVAPRSSAPEGNSVPELGGGKTQQAGEDALGEWAEQVGSHVEVPVRALQAYGNAELVIREEMPDCQLSWTTLAGIGRVESNHGRYGDATLGEDGRPSEPIIGVPLDGSDGVQEVLDTDDGQLDGDTEYDRAVGPMQFIPSTWENYGADATGDGKADPQQIDDAALAAGRYLCADERDMAESDGWWAGVFSYNHSVEYGQKVFGLADSYSQQAESVDSSR